MGVTVVLPGGDLVDEGLLVRNAAIELAACGFDPESASFCSALGLMHYLEGEMADDILRFVASLAPSSEIVFTFVLPDDDLDGVNLEVARRAAARTLEQRNWENL
jgi:O-methyltransferase involved in polyketide biosynthesis